MIGNHRQRFGRGPHLRDGKGPPGACPSIGTQIGGAVRQPLTKDPVKWTHGTLLRKAAGRCRPNNCFYYTSAYTTRPEKKERRKKTKKRLDVMNNTSCDTIGIRQPGFSIL